MEYYVKYKETYEDIYEKHTAANELTMSAHAGQKVIRTLIFFDESEEKVYEKHNIYTDQFYVRDTNKDRLVTIYDPSTRFHSYRIEDENGNEIKVNSKISKFKGGDLVLEDIELDWENFSFTIVDTNDNFVASLERETERHKYKLEISDSSEFKALVIGFVALIINPEVGM